MQCSVPASLLQAVKLVILVPLVLLAVVATASNENPSSSTETAVELDQAGAPLQQLEGPEAYEEARHPVIRKGHMMILALAVIQIAVLLSMVASKKAAVLKGEGRSSRYVAQAPSNFTHERGLLYIFKKDATFQLMLWSRDPTTCCENQCVLNIVSTYLPFKQVWLERNKSMLSVELSLMAEYILKHTSPQVNKVVEAVVTVALRVFVRFHLALEANDSLSRPERDDVGLHVEVAEFC
ncbi:hypothetical protein EMWEY_00041360 [Eimeria maxima]|uniref:Uncharacterized protein n=1 Tax=Eimeria maxima TaxID=5804 RepID=U6M5D4_EIMMA|nr:hypothetical protein EMWEY_00041360 [Eimeria maxima]CDJ57639.1 hypothetical protein EMWEY_00041360 [Eimeria maxima]